MNQKKQQNTLHSYHQMIHLLLLELIYLMTEKCCIFVRVKLQTGDFPGITGTHHHDGKMHSNSANKFKQIK